MPSAVIVGAGVFGASLAHHLADQGWKVTLVEQFSPGHVRASSGGESRLIRSSHGGDEWYTRSSRRARELWQGLEEESGETLLVEAGVLWFAIEEEGWEAESERTLSRLDIPVERLSPTETARIFPQVGLEGVQFSVLEPEAGILHARRAVQALARQAVRKGARLITGTAAPDGGGVLVAGERLTGDHVVWAAGPWLARIFPSLVEVEVTQQDVFFFGADAGWSTPPVPGWVDYSNAAYGTGDLDGRGMKVAPDVEGPAFDPDQGARVPLEENLDRARHYLRMRFPSLADAPLVGTRTCQYTVTADTNFIIAPHPEHTGVWLIGGGSGHGFKHGPALAEYVQALLEGREQPDPRFGLGGRPFRPALRTAGAQSADEAR